MHPASIPEDLFDALLKFRCPKVLKNLLLALLRLSGTYEKTHREVSYTSLSLFLSKERNKLRKYLNQLIEYRILKETKDPRFPKALCLIINTNYKEWTCPNLSFQTCPTVEPRTSDSIPPPLQKTSELHTKSCPGKSRMNKKLKFRKFYPCHRKPECDKPHLFSSKDVRKYNSCSQSTPPVLSSCIVLPPQLPISNHCVRPGKSPPYQSQPQP